jgi:hypothetical protein
LIARSWNDWTSHIRQRDRVDTPKELSLKYSDK